MSEKIMTIGDLKKAIAEYQTETGQGDETPIGACVQAFTQRYPVDWTQGRIYFRGGYGGCAMYVHLPEGVIISDRRPNRM